MHVDVAERFMTYEHAISRADNIIYLRKSIKYDQ